MTDTYSLISQSVREPPGCIENQNYGAVSILAHDRKEVYCFAGTDEPLPMRSTAKPFQLLPYMLDGLHVSDSSPQEIDKNLAIMMSSHNGEPFQVERIRRILAADGHSDANLQCGVHYPLCSQTRHAMMRGGDKPCALHCNCSGKHTAMLSVCKHNRWPVDGYLEVEHPLQQRICGIISRLAYGEARTIPFAIDGCSLPSWVLPLREIASLFATFAAPRQSTDKPTRLALQRLFQAGTRYPEFIAGRQRSETAIMRRTHSRVFAKTGADGMYAMAIAPRSGAHCGLGVAIKISDGDSTGRIRALVASHILRELGEFKNDDPDAVDSRLLNFKGKAVGRSHCLLERGVIRAALEASR